MQGPLRSSICYTQGMKKIAVTIGDPAGIGPEVTLKAIASLGFNKYLPVVIGDICVIEDALKTFNLPMEIKVIAASDNSLQKIKNPKSRIQNLKDTLFCLDAKSLSSFNKQAPDANNGKACVAYIKKAVELALAGKVDAIVTAPISKESLKLAGYAWPGHTELLAELTGTKDYAMMLMGGRLRVILVTIHTALKNVPGLIKKEQVLRVIRLASKACAMSGLKRQVIAVAGLNPHAGEAGIFGMEETDEIIPAIEEARREGLAVKGPYPPDIVFHKAYKKEVDIVVCMYHDQGLIPLKMVAFESGVNVTVGLPIIRTSPDHGTAYDIAWKGIADPSSMIAAIKTALRPKI